MTSALLIMDVQQGVPERFGQAGLPGRLGRALAAARNAAIPVIFVPGSSPRGEPVIAEAVEPADGVSVSGPSSETSRDADTGAADLR